MVHFQAIGRGCFALLFSPISTQNDHFWSPEGPFLAKNLENKVFSVHTIQNLTFWNPNVAPQKVENFGPTDPPHNGRTVAPEAILFESPCRAHPET